MKEIIQKLEEDFVVKFKYYSIFHWYILSYNKYNIFVIFDKKHICINITDEFYTNLNELFRNIEDYDVIYDYLKEYIPIPNK